MQLQLERGWLMSSKDSIEIVSGYRSPNENEFFFQKNPKSTMGTRDLLEFLESEGYQIEFIPNWQIKSRITHSSLQIECGIRITKI